MPRPMIRIHDMETNEIVDREMNDQELEVYEAEKAAYVAAENAEKETNKAKELAQAKLAGLGLTVDDLKALGL